MSHLLIRFLVLMNKYQYFLSMFDSLPDLIGFSVMGEKIAYFYSFNLLTVFSKKKKKKGIRFSAISIVIAY